mgnify:CR=1 FL=1
MKTIDVITFYIELVFLGTVILTIPIYSILVINRPTNVYRGRPINNNE